MTMVEVFITNVQKRQQAKRLVVALSELFPASRINFDLDDCDRILRVEDEVVFPEQVIRVLVLGGYDCCVLE